MGRMAVVLWLVTWSAGVCAIEPDEIYGYRLMSPLERAEYKAEVRSLQDDPEELRLFLEEHRGEMDERAREQGVTLEPVSPPAE